MKSANTICAREASLVLWLIVFSFSDRGWEEGERKINPECSSQKVDLDLKLILCYTQKLVVKFVKLPLDFDVNFE